MSWFTPKCPINADEKEWLEDSFLWLIDEFGEETLQNVQIILPNETFFPDEFTADFS